MRPDALSGSLELRWSRHPRDAAVFWMQPADKQELLSEILAGYSSSGLPSSDAGDDDDDDETTRRQNASQFTLERSWTDVVRDHEALDKRQRDYQEAVWELLSTELDHISKLRVVVDVRNTLNTRISSVPYSRENEKL